MTDLMNKERPSFDQWIKEAKAEDNAKECGMYLFHNGTVRETAKATVREGNTELGKVKSIKFSYDQEKIQQALEKAKKMQGIYHVRVWLNEGELKVTDDIMMVLVGGDIRPNVINCLQSFVGEIKNECVIEKEIFE